MNDNGYPLTGLLALCFLASLLLSGCTGMLPTGAATPEDAAVQYAQKMQMNNFSTNQDSVQATQSAALTNRTLVMVQFTGTRIPGGAETCQFVMENDKARLFGWESHGGSGSCHAENDLEDTQPITAGGSMGGGTTQGDKGYSSAYGMVRDSQITKLRVTWSDGMVQPVGVQSSAYLAARDGKFNMQKIEGLNDQNAAVYTIDLTKQREQK